MSNRTPGRFGRSLFLLTRSHWLLNRSLLLLTRSHWLLNRSLLLLIRSHWLLNRSLLLFNRSLVLLDSCEHASISPRQQPNHTHTHTHTSKLPFDLFCSLTGPFSGLCSCSMLKVDKYAM